MAPAAKKQTPAPAKTAAPAAAGGLEPVKEGVRTAIDLLTTKLPLDLLLAEYKKGTFALALALMLILFGGQFLRCFTVYCTVELVGGAAIRSRWSKLCASYEQSSQEAVSGDAPTHAPRYGERAPLRTEGGNRFFGLKEDLLAGVAAFFLPEKVAGKWNPAADLATPKGFGAGDLAQTLQFVDTHAFAGIVKVATTTVAVTLLALECRMISAVVLATRIEALASDVLYPIVTEELPKLGLKRIPKTKDADWEKLGFRFVVFLVAATNVWLFSAATAVVALLSAATPLALLHQKSDHPALAKAKEGPLRLGALAAIAGLGLVFQWLVADGLSFPLSIPLSLIQLALIPATMVEGFLSVIA